MTSIRACRIAGTIASRLVHDGGAALAIDYGYAASRLGETLQAVQAHRFVEPLAEPGNADLTTHVDFSALARSARQAGAPGAGPWPGPGAPVLGSLQQRMTRGQHADRRDHRQPGDQRALAADPAGYPAGYQHRHRRDHQVAGEQQLHRAR